MIEKMLKTTVICRIEDRDKTLDSLRSLGILHVEQTVKPDSPTQSTLSQELEKGKMTLRMLEGYEPVKKTTFRNMSAEKTTKAAIKLFERNKSLKKTIEDYQHDREKLLPWGNFSPSKIKGLEEKNLFVYLCEASKDQVDNYKDKGTLEVISVGKVKTYFVIISTEEQPKGQLPLAPLPAENISLSKIEEKIQVLNTKLERTNKLLSIAASETSKIKEFMVELQEELEFIINKNGMGSDYVLSYIKGFVPVKLQKSLTDAAKKSGWAVLMQKPSGDDRAPTLMTVPKIFRLVSPIFDFIGISPGYNEWDVSICFLFFFTIFFAMIVGDAGYGSLFLLVGIGLKIYFRKNEKFRLPLNLFLLLSIATITWGALTCSYFGLPQGIFPRKMQGLKMLTDPSIKNNNIQYICFFLAAMQLSFARLWKAFILRDSLKGLGQLGWAMFIWGNFFTAVKLIVFANEPFPVFAFYLYGIALFLILVFYIQWNDVGSIFNAPFAFIGSFSDVLSYIRLFAVGLATYYIASSFNNMGEMVLQLSPYLFLATVIILLFGHLLNIALAFMAVLVHGIRLNTLEFSNQMELEWSGINFKPFKKQYTNDSIEEKITNSKKKVNSDVGASPCGCPMK